MTLERTPLMTSVTSPKCLLDPPPTRLTSRCNKNRSIYRSQSRKCRIWPILTLISSLPCMVFLFLVLLVFIPPSPTALAAASNTEDPDNSEVTTYQSIEEMDDVALEDAESSHSHSLLSDLLKTQNLLLEATQDVAKATKDMSVAMLASTSPAAIGGLQESNKMLEDQVANLTSEFELAKLETQSLTEENRKLENMQYQLTARVTTLEDTIKNLKTSMSVVKKSDEVLHSTDCPDEFEWVGEDCIYLGRGDQRRTWHEARGICHDKGGDLAVPSNLTLIASRLKGETMPGVWVGATDNLSNDGSWYWLVSGETVADHYWAEGSPKHDGGWTNCGALIRDRTYRMMEEGCSFYYYYMCQIFPKGFWKIG